jgi:hypothetical protein
MRPSEHIENIWSRIGELRTLTQTLTFSEKVEKTYIFQLYMAEGVGFEPTVRLPVRRFSRPVP